MSDKFQNKYRISSHRKPGWKYSSNGMYFITLVTQNRICNLGEIVNENSPVMKLSDFGKIVDAEWHKSFEIRDELILESYVIMPNHLHAIVVINNENDTETAMDGAIGDVVGGAIGDVVGGAIGDVVGGAIGDAMDGAIGDVVGGAIGDAMDGAIGDVVGGAIVETHGRASLRPSSSSPPRPSSSSPPRSSLSSPPPSPSSSQSSPSEMPHRLPKSISSFLAGFKSAVNSKIDDFIDEHNLNIPKYNRDNHFFQPNYHDHIIRNDESFHRISNYIINNPTKWADDKFFNP